MSKNKGGREVRKPKQVKKAKQSETVPSVLHVETSRKTRASK